VCKCMFYKKILPCGHVRAKGRKEETRASGPVRELGHTLRSTLHVQISNFTCVCCLCWTISSLTVCLPACLSIGHHTSAPARLDYNVLSITPKLPRIHYWRISNFAFHFVVARVIWDGSALAGVLRVVRIFCVAEEAPECRHWRGGGLPTETWAEEEHDSCQRSSFSHHTFSVTSTSRV